MFPLAVKSSMKSLELMPSSQRIKPKSEILRVREFGHNPKLGAHSAKCGLTLLLSQSCSDLDMEMVIQQDVGRLQVKME